MDDSASIMRNRLGTHERLEDAFCALAASLDHAARQMLLDQIAVVCITLARGAQQEGFLHRAGAYRLIARSVVNLAPLDVDVRVAARLHTALGLVENPSADVAVAMVLAGDAG